MVNYHIIMTSLARGVLGAEDSVRLLRTKNPPAPSVSARSTVSRLNGPRGPGRQLARYKAPPFVMTPA